MFQDHFVSSVPVMKYSGEDNYKCTVTATDLEHVFGTNWHSFLYRGSSTRRRIIGLIVIQCQKKKFPTLTILVTLGNFISKESLTILQDVKNP